MGCKQSHLPRAASQMGAVNSRSNDRYLETSDNRLFLIFNMALSRNLRVGAGIQYAVDNEFRFYNENNQNDSTYHLSSVPGIILNLQYSF